jgi:hypothetical protein
MSSANPALIVRVVSTIDDLAKGMADAKGYIDTVATAAIALHTELGLAGAGAKAAGTEMRTMADDIVKSGTATDAQVAALTKATAQFLAMKGAVGSAKDQLAGLKPAMDSGASASANWAGELRKFDGVLASVGLNIGTETRAVADLGDASGKTIGQLGKLATAGLAVGAGMAAFSITSSILQFTGLDKAIGDATVKLWDFGLAEQVAGAKQDVINRAIEGGAKANITYAEAVQFQTDKWNALKFAGSDAMLELTSAGVGWKGTLDTINGSVVEAVKFYLKAEVSQGALAKVYELTDAQVKAVAASLKAEADALTEAQAATKAMAAEEKKFNEFLENFSIKTHANAMKQTVEFTAARLAQTGVVNAAVIAELEAQTKLNAGIAQQVTAYDTLTKALDALHTKKVEGIGQTAQEQVLMDTFTQTLYDEAVALDKTNAGLQAATPAADALAGGIARADAQGKQFTNTLVLGIANLDQFNAEVSKFYDSFGMGVGTPSAANSAGVPQAVGGRRTAGARAEGGPVSAGESYWVGERGPELFTPRSAGAIQANGGAGSGGGGSTVIQLVVDGRVLAAIVNDHTTKQMRQSRQWPSA